MKCLERKSKVVGLISKKAENIYVLRDKKAEQSEKYNFEQRRPNEINPKFKQDLTRTQPRSENNLEWREGKK